MPLWKFYSLNHKWFVSILVPIGKASASGLCFLAMTRLVLRALYSFSKVIFDCVKPCSNISIHLHIPFYFPSTTVNRPSSSWKTHHHHQPELLHILLSRASLASTIRQGADAEAKVYPPEELCHNHNGLRIPHVTQWCWAYWMVSIFLCHGKAKVGTLWKAGILQLLLYSAITVNTCCFYQHLTLTIEISKSSQFIVVWSIYCHLSKLSTHQGQLGRRQSLGPVPQDEPSNPMAPEVLYASSSGAVMLVFRRWIRLQVMLIYWIQTMALALAQAHWWFWELFK